MIQGRVSPPKAVNEPIFSYEPGSPERSRLKDKLNELASREIEIPLIIGGKEVRTGNISTAVMPHDHGHVLARYHQAGPNEAAMAVKAARDAWKEWAYMPVEARAAIFKKMALLLAGPWRDTINAATMLNIGKNAFQAEIDAACELIDFLNFNVEYVFQIFDWFQPNSSRDTWNMIECRPLEGFIFAVTPFNFTAIAGNLPTTPALVGNTVVWKPASSAVYNAYHLMLLFKEAGLPDGVINFVPGPGSKVGPLVMADPGLSGIHFTGSTPTFQNMWSYVGSHISQYNTYPRIVGETGGKDFIVVHESADVQATVTGIIRGAFEYQGQKCSAASRVYIPRSLWPHLRERYVDQVASITMGDVRDFGHFMNAVIDRPAFDKIVGYIKEAQASDEAEILTGGTWDDEKGYFIAPTTVVTSNPKFKTMTEEIFGPVVTFYIYDGTFDEVLNLCDTTGVYGLTGGIFAMDRQAVLRATKTLTHAAGNFYINDKPTGAVVGQQPFGGSRASGTNDKAGSALNLLRWMSQRSIKENLLPPMDYRYPFMGA